MVVSLIIFGWVFLQWNADQERVTRTDRSSNAPADRYGDGPPALRPGFSLIGR